MPDRTIAIAQPTFLPWLGWFDLADQADAFVILDDVAFSRQSWQQRNRIRGPQGLELVTVPVRTAGRLGQRICDTALADGPFAAKLAKRIAASYARAPHFARLFPAFVEVLEASARPGRLVDLNCGLIDWLAGQLGVATPRTRSSELDAAGARGEHVAQLCERLQGRRYLSPAGAEDYLLEDRAAFDRRSIRVDLQVYEHPGYAQCFNPFLPYASALDLVFNAGEAAGEIMRSGRRPPRPLGAGAPVPAQE